MAAYGGSPGLATVGDGMATPQELQIVGWVSDFVEREYGTVPGPPTERDGKDGSGLTVDFTFEDADPRFAVEVTRLRDDFEDWDADDLRRFKARIARFVDAKGWPDRKSTRLNSSHRTISYAVVCLKKKLNC